MKKVFTTGQVAKICKVAPRTVSKWFDSGRLKGYRIPGSQDRRIPREQLIRFLKEHGMPLGELEEEEWHKILLIGTEKLFNDRLKELLPEDEDYKFEQANSGFEAGILAGQLPPGHDHHRPVSGPQRGDPDHGQPAQGRGLLDDADRRPGQRGRGRPGATGPVRLQRHLQEAVRPGPARRAHSQPGRTEAGSVLIRPIRDVSEKRLSRFSEASLTIPQLFQILPKTRIGLGDAAGVLDDDARHAQADQGQAHRHAVVVVGLDRRRRAAAAA